MKKTGIVVRGICRGLSCVLLAVLALGAAALALPYLLGFRELAVLTGSMQPALPAGSLVYVNRVDPSLLQAGDIVTWQLPGGSMVTHRVIGVDAAAQTVETKGDANESTDAPVAFAAVSGKMALSVPYLGWLCLALRTRQGIAGVCGMVLAVIVLAFVPEMTLRGEKTLAKHCKNSVKSADMRQTPEPKTAAGVRVAAAESLFSGQSLQALRVRANARRMRNTPVCFPERGCAPVLRTAEHGFEAGGTGCLNRRHDAAAAAEATAGTTGWRSGSEATAPACTEDAARREMPPPDKSANPPAAP